MQSYEQEFEDRVAEQVKGARRNLAEVICISNWRADQERARLVKNASSLEILSQSPDFSYDVTKFRSMYLSYRRRYVNSYRKQAQVRNL